MQNEKLNCLPNHDAILTKLKFQTRIDEKTITKDYQLTFRISSFRGLTVLFRQLVKS